MTIVVSCAFVVLATLLIASDPVTSQQQQPLDVYNPGLNVLSQAISPLKSLFDSIGLPIMPQIHQSNSQSQTQHQPKQTTKSPRRKVKNKQRPINPNKHESNSRTYPDSYDTEDYVSG
jgi:hypothetical protein